MQKKNDEKKLINAFNDFIKYCRVRNLANKTLDYYEECFRIFTEFYPQENSIKEITKKTIDDYIMHLKNNTGLNSVSINTRLRGLRVILYHFMKLDYLSNFKIDLMKVEKKIKSTYTDAELKILLEKPHLKQCSFTTYRDWVVINYLLSTGNRVSTVVNLKIKDLDFENGMIQLEKTKNKRQQIIPMSKTLSKILLEYLQYRNGDPEEYLFCNIYGNKLTEHALQQSISKYNKKRGVMKTSIHLFRHTFAKKWILSNGDVFRLQKVLGHASLDIVREYVNMFSEDLKQDFHKYNALEQITTYQNSGKENIKLKRK